MLVPVDCPYCQYLWVLNTGFLRPHILEQASDSPHCHDRHCLHQELLTIKQCIEMLNNFAQN